MAGLKSKTGIGGKPSDSTNVGEALDLMNIVITGVVVALFVALIGVLVALIIFSIQALHERTATYGSLLERVIILETKLSSCVYVPR